MKKTLVALAVAAVAASSANAATVYEAEGTKVEVSGSLRLYLGRLGDDKRGDLVNDGSRLIFKASHQLGNGLSVLGNYELRFTNGSDNNSNTFANPSTKRLYAGLALENVGTLTFGRQATNADDVLQDSAYYNSGALIPLKTEGNKTIKFRSAEVNGFSFGLDYLFGNADKTRTAGTDEAYKQGYAASVFYNYELGEHQFNFAGVYAQDKFDGTVTNAATDTVRKYTTWATHLGYNYGPFDLGLSYGQYKNKFENGKLPANYTSDIATSKKGNYVLVDAGFRVIEPSRLYVQWERLDSKSPITIATGKEKSFVVNRYVAGVDYQFNKNVVTYVEYAQERSKISVQDRKHETEKDNVFGVGLRVFF